MLSLIILLIFGLLLAYFATQNVQMVSVTLANSKLSDIPMYLVVIVSLLIGIILSWLISLPGAVSSSLAIFNKNKAITTGKKDAVDLNKRIKQLEQDNEKLTTQLNSLQSN